MAAKGKKKKLANSKVDKTKKYRLEDALKLSKEVKYANFNETVDITVKLGIDPKHSDQNVRGSVNLPSGTGKTVRVLVFAKANKAKEATDAGADYTGLEELVTKIQEGWLEFDKVVATPDVMGQVGKLGKILGPRNLMPNPKLGTVTFDVTKAIKDLKSGKVDFKTDKGALVHVSVGKSDFETEDLITNAKAFFESLIKLKPDSSKGQFIKSISVSTTMGPGLAVDAHQVTNMF